MIQRIQSVFLLLVALVMISILFLPIWNKIDLQASEVVNLNAFYLTYEKVDADGSRSVIFQQDTFYISILAILSAGVALFSIFQYHNRLRQIQLGALNSLLMAGTVGLAWFFSTKGEALMNPEQQGRFDTGFYIIIAALIFNSMANRFIRRDEKLVKSADRIR